MTLISQTVQAKDYSRGQFSASCWELRTKLCFLSKGSSDTCWLCHLTLSYSLPPNQNAFARTTFLRKTNTASTYSVSLGFMAAELTTEVARETPPITTCMFCRASYLSPALTDCLLDVRSPPSPIKDCFDSEVLQPEQLLEYFSSKS